MGKMQAVAWMPMRTEVPEWKDTSRRGRRNERVQFFIPGARQLHQLIEAVGSVKFFLAQLDVLMTLGVLEQVGVSLKHRGSALVPDRQLSEGEQQFITMMGAILSTEGSEALYLLDEPDSHLNPRWTHEYVDHLTSAFLATRLSEDSSNGVTDAGSDVAYGTSQVLLATHNPLTIGPLTRDQVRILSRTVKGVTAQTPKYDPRGVGVDGLLKMDVFGLRSTLDSEMTAWLDEYYLLAGRPNLNDAQTQRKEDLEKRIREYGIPFSHPNPYFNEFAIQMRKSLPQTKLPSELDQETLERQARLSERIFKNLVEKSK
ncbi:AAA family ATPase [Deinococcus roseus]|uniref:ATPase AAA-type core domain-containing protein n=1 Tax=Deinococcus roseus TaxID=392414 RepID=A0ABQ2DLP4_9DEIO|nr:AAA family ATPase [Deinococcus roseus]GGJ59808.1 hypothetical protein GCM10008938_52440 [Deinococcus roseus]